MKRTIVQVDTIKERIRDILRRDYWFHENDGVFSETLDVFYRDAMSPETALKILNAEHPQDTFNEVMEEWYSELEWQEQDSVAGKIAEEMEDVDRDLIDEIISEMLYFDYPSDHFLQQRFRANILIDTGDGNYDFVLNSPYPSYDGEYEAEIDDEASLVWLAETQGYSKTQLWNALQQGDVSDSKGFLESVRVEVANETGHMNILVFLVEMTLEQLIKLQEHISGPEKRNGYLVVDRKTMTGLYDPWYGGGSVLGIDLEKDVKIPFKYIRSVLPDGGDGYGIDNIYGMCDSAWQHGGVKKIVTTDSQM